MPSQIDWVAVDWGTSNLRAWALDSGGAVVESRSSPEGMGRLTREQYPGVLASLLSDLADPADVLICGMAGARQGWLEAPYLDAPADLTTLERAAVSPEMPGSRLAPRILPGVCQRDIGAEDVMRGEETQLLGLSALLPGFEGLVVMPGTHSKWARLSGTRLERFSTAMTGELFELLRTQSVLRHSFTGDLEGEDREVGFERGIELGIDRPERHRRSDARQQGSDRAILDARSDARRQADADAEDQPRPILAGGSGGRRRRRHGLTGRWVGWIRRPTWRRWKQEACVRTR